MEHTVVFQPLDGGDLLSVCLHGQHETCLHEFPTHEHRAGTTLPYHATYMGACQVKRFAKKRHQ
jgi:hypothetical protein